MFAGQQENDLTEGAEGDAGEDGEEEQDNEDEWEGQMSHRPEQSMSSSESNGKLLMMCCLASYREMKIARERKRDRKTGRQTNKIGRQTQGRAWPPN